MMGSCNDSNEPLGSIKDGKFLDYLSKYLFFIKGSAPWGYLVVSNKKGGTKSGDHNFICCISVKPGLSTSERDID
jgi:hypothetical protein